MTTRRIFQLILSLASLAFVSGSAVAQPRDLSSPDGRRHLAAVPLDAPITLDGRLDERVWREATVADGFVQAEPREGEPATERTEVRVAFDKDALYIGVFCADGDPSRLIVNDIRKDFAPGEQDSFEARTRWTTGRPCLARTPSTVRRSMAT